MSRTPNHISAATEERERKQLLDAVEKSMKRDSETFEVRTKQALAVFYRKSTSSSSSSSSSTAVKVATFSASTSAASSSSSTSPTTMSKTTTPGKISVSRKPSKRSTLTKDKAEEEKALSETKKNLAQKFNYRTHDALGKISESEFEKLKTDASMAKRYFNTRHKIKEGAESQVFDLARCYHHGIRTAVNANEAVEWYELAVQFNYIPAMFSLSLILLHHNQNPKRGLELLEAAAKSEPIQHEEALYTLGMCYLSNHSVEVSSGNLIQAQYYLALAHKLEHPRAAASLEHCYKFFRNYGVPIPEDDLQLSFEDRISDSIFTITEHQRLRGVCTKKDELKKITEEQFIALKANAEKELTASEKANSETIFAYAKANFDLAQCYYCGWHVEKNTKLAIKCCEKAIKFDYPPAENFLGFIYQEKAKEQSKMHEDQSTQEDLEQTAPELEDYETIAFQYFSSAATKGFIEARYNLGCCYLNDGFMQRVGMTNCVKSYTLGFAWLMRAALQGFNEAEAMIANCHQHPLKDKFIPKHLTWTEAPTPPKPSTENAASSTANTIASSTSFYASVSLPTAASSSSTNLSAIPAKSNAGIKYFTKKTSASASSTIKLNTLTAFASAAHKKPTANETTPTATTATAPAPAPAEAEDGFQSASHNAKKRKRMTAPPPSAANNF